MKWLLFISTGLACLVVSGYMIAQGTVIVTLRSNCPSSFPHIIISEAQFGPLVTLGDRSLFVIVGSSEGSVTVFLRSGRQNSIPGSYVTGAMISYFSLRANRSCKVNGGRWGI
jgi:hypothetical protein